MDGSLSRQPGVVALSGELDAAEYETVRVALAAALSPDTLGDQAEIVVDLRAVKFMDAGTVGLLLEAWRTSIGSGHRLRVTGACDPVRRVIEAAGAGYRLLGTAERDIGLVAGGSDDRLRAATQRQRAELDQSRILARLQQQAIDGEVRTSRRLLLSGLRKRLRTDPRALSGEEFLGVADRATVLDGILLAATIVGAADACDLQLYDPDTATLRIARQRGFTREFLAYFASVDLAQPTAYAIAAATGEPVIVDDVTRSPVFAGRPTLDVMLAAGSRAVHSHPLHDEAAGSLLGVLSFHYRARTPHHGDRELVAWSAARALSAAAG